MFRMIAVIAGAGLLSAGLAEAAAPAPWMDKSLTPDARADLVQAQMTQDEQLVLLKGYYGANVKLSWIKPAPVELRPLLPGSAGFVPGVARLGIPELHESDAGIGIANTNLMRPGDTATAFPAGVMNAATWNPDLAYAGGAAIGAEARMRGFNVVLDGGINLMREPRGGRTFEYGGEDPLLAGTIVGEQIRGIQSQHVISTIKHYALNDQEIGRGILNVDIDEGAARESDLLAFEIAIERGNPGAVMCAYNKVNGPYSCENDFLLNRVLKHDWGYTGWVLSDWGGVHSTVAAANGGLDQESASGFDRQEYFGAPLAKALADGTVPPERLHDMVHRILRTMFANGLIDDPPAKVKPTDNVEVAERNAEQGVVLLKNDGNLLPLASNARAQRVIAVIGGHAGLGTLSGGGSSQVLPIGHQVGNEVYVGGGVIVLPNGAKIMPLGREIYDPPAPLAAIAREAPLVRVNYLEGDDIAALANQAASADVVIIFAEQWMTEGQDVSSLSLPGRQDAMIAAVAAKNPRTVVVLETGGPVLMPWLDKVGAVLEAWYPGNGGATAIARILFGDADPSGRLPVTFPMSTDQLPRPSLPDVSKAYAPFDVDYNVESADVGYRWFAKNNLTPLFPFGFGLSYTSFKLDGFAAKGGDTVTASVNVTNTGGREGSEVVQLYATPPADGTTTPVARLIGFSKVDLKPGETKTVALTGEPRSLAHFDTTGNVWRIAAGSYAVSVRTSATDIVASADVDMPLREIKP